MREDKDVQITDVLVVETPLPGPLPNGTEPKPPQKVRKASVRFHSIPKHDLANARGLQDRCRQVCISLFLDKQAPVRSLGITSPVAGEGKTFLSLLMAGTLANDSSNPVTLVECNWEHPSVHEYFALSPTPGLAEWLRQECSESDIRHQVSQNLTIIPAGDGKQDAVKLLQQMRQKSLIDTFVHRNELVLVDLPSIVTTAYGSLATSLVESLIIVIRAGKTPEAFITETTSQLKDLPVHGLILNQITSHIPGWIRQIL